MAEGLTVTLLWTALCTGAISLWIASRYLSSGQALATCCIKFALPLIYFAWFVDGTWTILDDQIYLAQGKYMLQRGYTPITALTTSEGRRLLLSLSEGRHILYGWRHIFAQYVFGFHYYAPVFLNIILTFIGGYFLFRSVRLLNVSQIYARSLAVFFLVHWDMLAWSSFLNLKDIAIMTLTILAFYLILVLAQTFSVRNVINLGIVTVIFLWIRFYTPIIIALAAVVWLCLYVSGRRKYVLLSVMGMCGVIAMIVLGPQYVIYYVQRLDLVGSLTGSVRMALTPQPWSIEPTYSYLKLPAILHWIFFFPAVIGGWMLAKRSQNACLFLIYLLLALLVYGSFPELQGPRHRVQFAFIIIWMQFHFLWLVLPRSRRAVQPSVVMQAERVA